VVPLLLPMAQSEGLKTLAEAVAISRRLRFHLDRNEKPICKTDWAGFG
jgi:hypothetical protein